jgi:Na+/proline symporter
VCSSDLHRYNYKKLSLIITIIGIAVLSNYLLAQLMAMGRAMQGISGDTGGSFYIAGVLVLATIIVIYGTMGGLRAVAWTDAIQGVILLVGFTVLLIILFDKFGPLSKATAIIANMDDINNTRKSLVPDSQTCRLWLSYIIILGFGLSLYPQAIQRIYAAKSEKVLKKSLAVMAFMPIPTMIISVIAGIMALAYISGLEGTATDQVFGQVLREVQEYSLLGYGLSVVILAAILAAMMSTADSALLTISSMFTKDIYAKIFKETPNEKSLLLVGKFCSWGFLALMIVFAIILKDNTSLVKLMDRKLDLMIQVSPAFMLGIHFIWLKAKPVFWGIICGTIIALSIPYLDFSFISKGKVFGFHAGLVGVVPNLAIALIGSYFERKKT